MGKPGRYALQIVITDADNSANPTVRRSWTQLEKKEEQGPAYRVQRPQAGITLSHFRLLNRQGSQAKCIVCVAMGYAVGRAQRCAARLVQKSVATEGRFFRGVSLRFAAPQFLAPVLSALVS